MAVATARMFPPRPGARPRRRGKVPKQGQIGFRPPDALKAYIEDAVQAGYAKTEVILRLCETMMDAERELGADWYEIEKQAKVERVPAGILLGRYAKAGLKKRG